MKPRRFPEQRGLRILDSARYRVTNASSDNGRSGTCCLITGGDFRLVAGRQAGQPGNESIAPHATPVAAGRPAAGSRPSRAGRSDPHTHHSVARNPSFDKVDDDSTSHVKLTPQPYFKGYDSEALPFPRGTEPTRAGKYFKADLATASPGCLTRSAKVGLQTAASAHGAQGRLRRPRGPPRP